MKLGRWEIEREIGRGGAAVVYRARNAAGELAAVKVLHEGRDNLAAFAREERLQGLLGSDAGFVPIIETGLTASGPFFVMPLLEGGDLRRRIERGRLPVAEARTLVARVARAVALAHEAGIVHRDLKPENVLFTADGVAFVADLGLAKHFDRSAPGASRSASMTHEGALKGTVGYMPPEQIADARNAGPVADVFALGAILYECLSGERAFQGANVIEVFQSVEKGVFEPLRARRPEVPAELDAIVRRALARDPRARFPDARALAKALEGVKAGGDAGARSRVAKLAAGLGVLSVLGGLGVAVALRARERGPTATPTPPPVTRPVDVDEHLRAGRRALDASHFLSAIAAFTSAVAADPKRADGLEGRALAKALASPPMKAGPDARAALALRPGSPLARAVRAHAEADAATLDALALERPEDADVALLVALVGDDPARVIERGPRAIELAPRGTLPRVRLARHLRDKTRFDQARALLDRALELEPTCGLALVERSTVRILKDHDAEGTNADVRRAFEVDPECFEAAALYGFAKLGEKDFVAAKSAFARAASLRPDFGTPYRGFALCAIEEGDFVAARAFIEKFRRIEPNDGHAAALDAQVRFELGDLRGALDAASRALELEPMSTAASAWRGLARSRLGEREAAIADLRRYLPKNSKPIASDPLGARVLAELEKLGAE